MDRRLFLGAGASLAGVTAFFPDGAAAQTAPSVSTARFLDRKVMAKMLKATPRTAILAARVGAQTGHYAHASSTIGAGGWTSTLDIAGLGGGDLRAVADAAIEDLSIKLVGAGREIVPRAEVLAHPALADLATLEQPAQKPWRYPGGGAATDLQLLWASDSGGRLFFYHIEAWNPFAALQIKNWQRMNWLSKDLNAIVLVPTYVYTFGETYLEVQDVQINGATRNQGARAEVSGEMQLVDYPSSVWAFRGLIKIAGEMTDLKFKGPISLGMPGEFQAVGSSGTSARFAFRADPARFRTAAFAGAQAMNSFTAGAFSQLASAG